MSRSLKTLYIFNGIFGFAGSLFGPLYALFVKEISGDILSVSLTWSIFLISSMLFNFVISKIGDKVKEKEYLLMAGFAVRGIVWFSYIFVPNIIILGLLQILLGLGEALGSPAFNAIFAEHLDKGRHIEEYADWYIISRFVGAGGTALGGLIAATYGFDTLFAIMAALSLVSFIGVLSQPRKLL
jgi:MFS family permease